MTRARFEPQGSIRALVVDDDPMILGLLCAFLRARGYAVEQSKDGVEALEQLRAGGFNLVVTDRDMPRMDGLDLCRAIRALQSDSYIYCVMLTSMRAEESLVAAMEAGVDDFLAKPLRLPELGARLHAAERVLSLEAGLAARNGELARAYGQLSRELELARVLQLGQLPSPRRLDNVRFDWMFEASGFVGGDIFDYFALDERHLCFYLADVSGHGVAAAMMAFHVQRQLRASLAQGAPTLVGRGEGIGPMVEVVVSETNRRFLQMGYSGLYFTLLFGVLDRQAGVAALVQAGHPPPLVATRPATDWHAVGEGGVPVGILPEPGYRAIELPLPPGARLVVYSDGVTDCRDHAGTEFGLARLQALLRAQDGMPLEQSCAGLREALRDWHGPDAFEDDITLLALEVH